MVELVKNEEIVKKEEIVNSVPPPPGYNKIINNLTKSPADTREFRALELNNGLKVMLVHDKDTDKSAAALAVAAGCMCDPMELPGLAHFLEHMLFLGTEKYPEESGFDIFLNQNGGYSNAFTSLDKTLYFFEVSTEKLALALDRFAQFFISPLFNESATEREVNAVNSEHEKNIPSDSRRVFRVHQITADPNHPFSKFASGNRYSLWVKPQEESIDVRKSLLEFHDTFYSSDLMALTVIGKDTLDELQVIVESLFSALKNKERGKRIWTENPYGDKQLQLRMDVLPIRDLRQLILTFPVPDTTAFYKSDPTRYVSHLTGHEGEGSLLSLLKRKGWVNELVSGLGMSARGFSLFQTTVTLTIEGWSNVNSIIEHAFQYFKILQDEEPQKWIWEEIKDVEVIQFQFQDKPAPGRDVITTVEKLHEYPLEDILTARHILTEYNPKLIRDIINCLTPATCRVTTLSKENESVANLVEQWYGVKYAVYKINPDLIQQWTNCEKHVELKLPQRNQYIPSAFDLKPREDTGIIPQLLVNNSMSRAWFLQDNEFLLPKARIQMELYSPLPLLEPLQSALNAMMTRVIEDSLTELTYGASVAGLSHSVSSSIYGQDICVRGYDHKLKVLLNTVLDKLINFSVDPERFTILKEVYTRTLKNWEESEPRIHGLWFVSHILSEKDWTRQELLESLKDVTVERLQLYVEEFVSKLRLEWLFCGNMTSEEAKKIVQDIQDQFEQCGTKPLPIDQKVRLRSVQLPSGSDLVFKRDNLSHSSSCAAVLFQGGVKNTRDNMIIELLGLIAEQPCFQQLRTKEQLGYVCYASVKKHLGTLGLMVVVQSNFHPTYLESRIDNFLLLLREKIDGLNEEEFSTYSTALRVRKSEKVKTLTARATFVWHEIAVEEYNFDRKNLELKELDSITHADVKKYFEDLVGHPVKERGRLGVHIISQTTDGAGKKSDPECFGPCPFDLTQRNIQPISNVVDWKKGQNLHCRPKPALEIPVVV